MARHQPDDYDPWGSLWSDPWPWLEDQLAKEAHVDLEPFRWGRTNQALADKTDAAKECVHGKLPGDRVQTCSCWLGDAA